MGWRFAPERGPRAALQRALDQLVERALASLADPRGPAAHEPRKAVKRIRAVLRLARDGIGRAERRRLDALVRRAARAIGPLRDAEVLPRTIAALTRGEATERVAAGAIEASLRSAREALAVARAAAAPSFVTAVARLVEARGGIRRMRLRGGWPSLFAGLRRAYRRARDAGAALDASASADAFHRWRKRVKDLQHQIDAFSPAGGTVPLEARRVARLADLLGAEHDLALLDDRVRAERDAFAPRARTAVIASIAARRARLRASALRIAARTFLTSPRAFAGAVETRWRAARRAAAASATPRASARSAR